MSCTECNDGCFDESVQLAQGPTGATGAAATNNLLKVTDSSDTVEIGAGAGFTSSVEVGYLRTSLDTDVTERTHATSSYSADKIAYSLPGGTLVNVGDILRLEFSIIGDHVFPDASTSKYYYKITFGGTVIDTETNPAFHLYKANSAYCNGGHVTLDLIVSATNQVTPIIKTRYGFAFRTAKFIADHLGKVLSPPSFAVLSNVSATLSGDLPLQLQLKSSDNSSTVGLQYHSITKFIKEA